MAENLLACTNCNQDSPETNHISLSQKVDRPWAPSESKTEIKITLSLVREPESWLEAQG